MKIKYLRWFRQIVFYSWVILPVPQPYLQNKSQIILKLNQKNTAASGAQISE